MSELTMISPLLNGMTDAEQMASHAGTTVYRVRHQATGLYFVVKHISIPESAEVTNVLVEKGTIPTFDEANLYYQSVVDQYRKELVQFHNLSEHPNISSCLRFQVAQKTDQPGFDLYMLSPFHTSLLALLRENGLSRKMAIQVGIDLCNALIVLRNHGFIHQNLKPENIFLENGHFALSGFGLADAAQTGSLAKRYLSGFTAPEAFRKNTSRNQTMDLYAVGLLLYYIYNENEFPFSGEFRQSVQQRTSGNALPVPRHADTELTALLQKACAFQPEDRFQTPEELRNALQIYQLQIDEPDAPVVPHADGNSNTGAAPVVQPEDSEAPQQPTAPTASGSASEPIVQTIQTETAPPVPPAPAPKKKRNLQKLTGPLIVIAAVLLVAVIGSYFYFGYSAIHVSEITILDKSVNSITIGLEATNASSLIVTCSTEDGTAIASYRADNTVTFSSLESGTTYHITVDSMDWHYVRGITGGTATTTAISDILKFEVTAQDDQTASVSLEVDGPAPETWTIHCSSIMDEDAVYTLDGNSGTLTDLVANCDYTLTLDAGSDYYLLGASSTTFSYQASVSGSDLKVANMNNESITVSWTPDHDTASAWTAVCSGKLGEEQTVVTGECSATFTGLSSGVTYSITVTNSTMPVPMALSTKLVAAEVSDFTVSTSGTNASLTWDAAGYALPETWLLSYQLDSMIAPQTMEVTGSEAELPYLLPGSTYTFTLSDPSGTEIEGKTEVTATTGATQYGTEVMPDDITFYADQADEKIVCGVNSPTVPLSEGTVVLVTLSNADGFILACGSSVWEKDATSANLTIDTLPEESGIYALSLYCNSQRLQSSTFTIE